MHGQGTRLRGRSLVHPPGDDWKFYKHNYYIAMPPHTTHTHIIIALSNFIRHYEPLTYDSESLLWNHHRMRRSMVGERSLELQFTAFGRWAEIVCTIIIASNLQLNNPFTIQTTCMDVQLNLWKKTFWEQSFCLFLEVVLCWLIHSNCHIKDLCSCVYICIQKLFLS